MRVEEAARIPGYRHTIFAGSLRKLQTNTIGIIVHELRNNFITSVLASIPVVFFDRVEEHPESTKVVIDNYTCGNQATKHWNIIMPVMLFAPGGN